MRGLLLCNAALLITTDPALARGKHIICNLSGSINDGSKSNPSNGRFVSSSMTPRSRWWAKAGT